VKKTLKTFFYPLRSRVANDFAFDEMTLERLYNFYNEELGVTNLSLPSKFLVNRNAPRWGSDFGSVSTTQVYNLEKPISVDSLTDTAKVLPYPYTRASIKCPGSMIGGK
jgi:hypothetical protein